MYEPIWTKLNFFDCVKLIVLLGCNVQKTLDFKLRLWRVYIPFFPSNAHFMKLNSIKPKIYDLKPTSTETSANTDFNSNFAENVSAQKTVSQIFQLHYAKQLALAKRRRFDELVFRKFQSGINISKWLLWFAPSILKQADTSVWSQLWKSQTLAIGSGSTSIPQVPLTSIVSFRRCFAFSKMFLNACADSKTDLPREKKLITRSGASSATHENYRLSKNNPAFQLIAKGLGQ